jgi:carbonic anhydrase/acetyltransferase-like protein (isoleucine patch superfamily)
MKAMNAELMKRFPVAAYIDASARVYGNVQIGEGSSLWPYTVIRSEGFHVRLGRFSNLQDHVMVHVGYARPTIVGDYCSITHRVVLHGCTIGNNCLIGIGATIMEGAVIGDNSIVAGHAFVADGTIIPPNSIVMGTPAKVVRTKDSFVANRLNAMLYFRNARSYARGDHRAWEGPEYEAEMARWKAEIEGEAAARSS